MSYKITHKEFDIVLRISSHSSCKSSGRGSLLSYGSLSAPASAWLPTHHQQPAKENAWSKLDGDPLQGQSGQRTNPQKEQVTCYTINDSNPELRYYLTDQSAAVYL